PEVLALANRLLAGTPGRAPGAGKRLVATRPSGPEPTVAAFENAEREVKALVAEVGRLVRAGVDPDEVAVLVRTNAQIPPLEEALAAAGIRYQVRGELFFRRTEVLRAIGVLRSRTARAAGGGLVDALEAVWFERFGFRRDEEPDGEEARQRHASLVTLLGIAERLEGSGASNLAVEGSGASALASGATTPAVDGPGPPTQPGAVGDGPPPPGRRRAPPARPCRGGEAAVPGARGAARGRVGGPQAEGPGPAVEQAAGAVAGM